jgi:tetratricopeptide (TPR) repeat protein
MTKPVKMTAHSAVKRKLQDANVLAQLSISSDLQGNYADAVRHARRAVKVAPDRADVQNSLGALLARLDQRQLAKKCFERAIELAPEEPQGYLNLGRSLLDLFGRADQAAELFQQALRIAPQSDMAYFMLCCALVRQGPVDRVLSQLHRLRTLMPDRHRAYISTVESLMREGRYFEAKACCLEALKMCPQSGEAHALLGEIAFVFREGEEAVTHYREAVRQSPNSDSIVAGFLRVLAGMACFEQAREVFQATTHLLLLNQRFRYRVWVGEPLAGKSLLLRTTRGNGDAIQFCRYAVCGKEQGARIIVQSSPNLQALLLTNPGIDAVVLEDELIPEVDYEFDFELFGLPLGMDLDTAGGYVPYLFPSDAIRADWGNRIKAKAQLRVCLAWSGGQLYENDPYRQRAIPLSQLQPILNIPGIAFFTVQKGRGAKELQEQPSGMITNLATEIRDYLDTAAILTHMDLVISNDSSIAHLAGAIGAPTWVLLPYAADWRWQLHRDDSPWYPTMRLFRQPYPGEWADPVNAVCEELRKLINIRAAEAPIVS